MAIVGSVNNPCFIRILAGFVSKRAPRFTRMDPLPAYVTTKDANLTLTVAIKPLVNLPMHDLIWHTNHHQNSLSGSESRPYLSSPYVREKDIISENRANIRRHNMGTKAPQPTPDNMAPVPPPPPPPKRFPHIVIEKSIPQPTQDQLVRYVSEWIRTREENGLGPPTSADADHSALLRRLFSGKPKLPKAPPLRFGYPDYKLGEGEQVMIHEIISHDDRVVIDQCNQWTWSSKADGLLCHIPTNDIYKLTTISDSVMGLKKAHSDLQRVK
jgi:hypothetical protein